MLYEVITGANSSAAECCVLALLENPSLDPAALRARATRRGKGWAVSGHKRVITSYSIHYTELYENMSTEPPGGTANTSSSSPTDAAQKNAISASCG